MTSNRHLIQWAVGLTLLFALFVTGNYLPDRFLLDIFIQVFFYAAVAVGLNLLVGLAGQISLGHAGFVGIGAYCAALSPAYLGLPTLLTTPLAVLLAGVLSYVIARPLLRLSGHYLAMTTLAFGMLVFILINNSSGITGGPDGIAVLPLRIGDQQVASGQTLAGARIWYMIFLAFLSIAVAVAIAIQRSPVGRALRAVRDSEIATRFCGIDVERLKLWIFVVSAMYASAAGSLLAHYREYVSPERADFMQSTILITMIALGGLGSTWGAVVGAAILSALPQSLVAFHDYENAFLGLILVLCMIFFRRGLVPTLFDRTE